MVKIKKQHFFLQITYLTFELDYLLKIIQVEIRKKILFVRDNYCVDTNVVIVIKFY